MEKSAFILKLETLIGSNIRYSVTEAIKIAKILNVAVTFDFNDQNLTVWPDTDIDQWFERHRKLLRL